MYYLEPVYDTHKSFYHKAYVVNDVVEQCYSLYSYEHHVMDIYYDGKVKMYNGPQYNSITTRRHKREFMLQHNVDPSKYL